MNVLGIETSCDETAAAVVSDGHLVRSSAISSQIEKHARFGGVVPELAAREHLKAIDPVIDSALGQAGCRLADIDAIAATSCPGLVPSLLVGMSYAKGLASAARLPFAGINHFVAHVFGAFIDERDLLAPAHFPLMALVVSGGHTSLLLVEANGKAVIVGRTLDDAAGEAFDKAAKILGLGYPGGPIIDRLSRHGDACAVQFPRGLTGGGGRPVKAKHRLDFSFSGVKTALLYCVQGRELPEQELADVVASYQAAIVDVLVAKSITAAQTFGAPTIVLCGGVACNSRLRAQMQEAAVAAGRRLVTAPPRYCTDNAAMVAGLAFYYLRRGCASGLTSAVGARLSAELGTVPFAPGAGA